MEVLHFVNTCLQISLCAASPFLAANPTNKVNNLKQLSRELLSGSSVSSSDSSQNGCNMLIARTGGLSRVLTSSFLLPPTRSSVPVTLQQNEVTASMSTTSADQAEVGPYEPGQHSIAYVTTPDENSAKALARKLVERKLAACVNIIPGLTSVYEWEGKLNEDHETLLMIKTRTSRVDELAKFVRENHPYSVAEVISVPIENGNPPYLEWLSRSVPERKKT